MFVAKVIRIWSKEELKTENRLSTFVVVGVVHTEIWYDFLQTSVLQRYG